MKKTFICVLDILIILFILTAALNAEDTVVPAMKSPYPINAAQFDNSGDNFAYEVNGKVYIRDSLSLLLKDSFAKSTKSDITAFYSTPERVDYPKNYIQTMGTSVIIKSQRSATSSIETKTINNLPAGVRSANVNRSLSTLAFIGTDNNAYIYDIGTSKTIATIPCYSSGGKVFITKDDKVIIPDSERTAGLYSTDGKKLKNYANANAITGMSLSPDEETLIMFDSNGTLNFYNTSTATHIGYVSNLGAKKIRNAQLSKDSKRILITTESTLFISPLRDILFSPNTTAKPIKQFVFNHSALDPNDKSNGGVTEFGVHEVAVDTENIDAEYILSTREKELGKQKFDLDEDKKAAEDILLSNQPEQAYFPPSLIEREKNVLFTDKGDGIKENQAKVREYGPAPTYSVPVPPDNPDQKIILPPQKNQPQYQTGNQNGYTTSGNGGTGSGGNGGSIIILGNGNDTGQTEETAKTADEVKEKEVKTKEKKEKKKKPEKEEENIDIKTFFKDGHGVLVNMGINRLKAPYTFEVSLPAGYRNYDLIQPFYFGGSIDFSLGFPGSTYPYKYYDMNGNLRNPQLVNIKMYAPIGFCIYPLKNSLEVYAETGVGINIHSLWNGQIGGRGVSSKLFPAFYGNIKAGVAWDFINISLCGSYDAILGFSYGIEMGVILNINGTRTIGSLIER